MLINNNTQGFYRLPEVLALIPISRSSWWAGVKDGRYPASIKIGPRTTAWLKLDIEELCVRLQEGRCFDKNS
jgi:prophage regulatory protein